MDEILMVTGHRKVSHPTEVLFECAALVSAIRPRLMKIGGAGGADTAMARAAVTIGVLWDLYLPNRWYRDWYEDAIPKDLVDQADRIVHVVDRPVCDDWRERWVTERWWMDNHRRNEAMAADSNVAVVISDRNPRDLLLEERGGTAACVKHLARYPDREVWWIPDVPDPKRVLVSLSDQPALPGIC